MISRIIAFLLLLQSLVASVSIGDEYALHGQWTAQLELAPAINYVITQEAPEFAEYAVLDSVQVKLVIEFGTDGSYHIYADEASVKAALEAVKPKIKELARQYIQDKVSIGSFGMSVDTFLSMSGIDLDALLEEYLGPGTVGDILTAVDSRGRFETADGRLYLYKDRKDDTVYELYTLSGGTLTVISGGTALAKLYNVPQAYIDRLYPMSFSKAR